MYTRIKLVRNQLGLSQTDFGAKIGVTIGVIRNLETNKTQLTSPLFELFCSIYNVNPNWLRTGEGDMFLPTEDSSLENLRKEYNLSDSAMQIVESFVQMSPDEQDSLIYSLKKLLND